ncbi:MAG: class I SAM-dependent rRNA methyltransferase [Gemmatimonadetes bacterium]|nr:class I SAM-dependent rRNA methyltransferase [Gemmatimonadota bacterium]
MAETARISRRGAARWMQGHPWIYRSDVVQPPPAVAGAVRVESEDGRFQGMALWSPRSTISLRMLTREERSIDGAFWAARIGAAAAYRERLAPDATAYRLVHGEADGLPSLVVDRYDRYLVVQLLSAGLERFRGEIVDALRERFEPAGILARHDVAVRDFEGLPRGVEPLYGTVPEQVAVREGAVRYLAAPHHGQKTGAFLDQRENRVRAGELSRGRALDCFAYHGSFALHLATRAERVVAVDSSGPALERAAANAALNGFAQITPIEANVFEFLRAEEAAGSRYDIVVVDPPAFAKRRDAVASAIRGYKEVNLRALRILEPGGYLCTFSCSYHVDHAAFREMLRSAAADAGRPVRWIEARGQALDHPELLQVAESAYLKGAILQAL